MVRDYLIHIVENGLGLVRLSALINGMTQLVCVLELIRRDGNRLLPKHGRTDRNRMLILVQVRHFICQRLTIILALGIRKVQVRVIQARHWFVGVTFRLVAKTAEVDEFKLAVVRVVENLEVARVL